MGGTASIRVRPLETLDIHNIFGRIDSSLEVRLLVSLRTISMKFNIAEACRFFVEGD